MAEQHDSNDPWTVLGVDADASPADVRSAYLDMVRKHPPDGDPEMFERIRDAYEQVRDPRKLKIHTLLHADPDAALAPLLDDLPPERRFVGPQPWLAVIEDA